MRQIHEDKAWKLTHLLSNVISKTDNSETKMNRLQILFEKITCLVITNLPYQLVHVARLYPALSRVPLPDALTIYWNELLNNIPSLLPYISNIYINSFQSNCSYIVGVLVRNTNQSFVLSFCGRFNRIIYSYKKTLHSCRW